MWKLFLDDDGVLFSEELKKSGKRFPPDNTFIIANTIEDAKQLIIKNGFPNFISFDNDLGLDISGKAREGIELVNWIIESVLDGLLSIPKDFKFNVHSHNPVASELIKEKMNSFLKYLNHPFHLKNRIPYSY